MGVDGFIVKSIISLVGSVGIKFCNGGELKLSRGSVGLVGKGVIGQGWLLFVFVHWYVDGIGWLYGDG